MDVQQYMYGKAEFLIKMGNRCVPNFSAIGGEITSDGDFLIFEGNRYSRKGFLYKNFLITAILSEGVKPTLAELERFEEQPEGMCGPFLRIGSVVNWHPE